MIFQYIKENKLSLPCFCRMEDYYRDSKFSANDLGLLIKDINLLLGSLSDNEALSDVLCEIKYLANKAIDLDVNLNGYCD